MGNKHDKHHSLQPSRQKPTPKEFQMDSKELSTESKSNSGSFEWKIIGTMPFLEFPQEVVLQIFSFMSAQQLCEMAKVCHFFKSLSESNEFWEPLFRRDKQRQICLVNGITTSWKTMYKETKIFASLQEAVDQATETNFRVILPKGVFTMNSSLRISNKKIELIGVPFLNQVLELFEEEHHIDTTKQPIDFEALKRKSKEHFIKEIQLQYRKESEVDKHQSVIQCQNFTPIVVDEGELLLKNVVVRQTSDQKYGFAIEGIKGKLRIENCQISSNSLSAIILQKEITFEFVKSHISHAGQAGIYSLGASTFISDSTIEFTKYPAIYIKYNAPNIKIVNTTIRNCLGSGIYLENFQKIQNISIENCMIRNTWVGMIVEMISDCDIRISNNKIHQTWTRGLYLDRVKGNVSIENNIISNTIKTGIFSQSSDCTFRNNRILSNNEHGFYVEEGKASILNNTFEGNLFSGVDVHKSYVVVTNNQIVRNNVGVYVFENGIVELIENDIHNNKNCGVEVRINSKIKVIKNNKIHNNGTFGVYILQTPNNISDHTEETLSKDNLIFSNQDKDILIETEVFVEDEISKNSLVPNIFKSNQNEEKEQKEKESQESSEKSSSEKKLEPTVDVKKAIKRGVCTFSTTGYHYHNQFWWQCETCGLIGTEGVCAVCKDICHKGHQLKEGGFSGFFCDCGASRPCMALEKKKIKQ